MKDEVVLVGEVIYTYHVVGGEVEVGASQVEDVVKDYIHGKRTMRTAIDYSRGGRLVIPAKLGGKKVTRIGKYAFFDCKNLTSVVIPKGVKEIGGSAFEGCVSLKSVKIPEGVERIDHYAFKGCKNLKAVKLPKSVKAIGWNVFDGCKSLEVMTIPKGVTSIASSLFFDCVNLKTVKIPESVKNINGDAFGWCRSLEEVKIPKGVTWIGSMAFIGCRKLKSITIPKGVKEIEDSVFGFCPGLKSITIPKGVVEINSGAFFDNRFKEIHVDKENKEFCSVDGVLFSKDKEELLCYPGGRKGGYEIPQGVTFIGEEAFGGCKKLTAVRIRASVEGIGCGAFSGANIQEFVVDEGNRYFSARDGVLFTKDGTQLVAYPCGREGAYEIPSGVIGIWQDAFRDGKLSGVTIPDSVKTIEVNGFAGCKNLTTLVFPDSVSSLGAYAFVGCSNLTSVTMSKNITRLDDEAFPRCKRLAEVKFMGLPPRVRELEVPRKMVGYYLPKYKKEWEAVIDARGQWKGLAMKMIAD